MAEFVLEDAPEYVAIPDGEILAAEVVNCEVREAPFEDRQNPGQKAKRVNFRFSITEAGEWQGRTIFGETPMTFSNHPDCKLRVWVQEILGEDDLPVGFKFNTDALIGLPVRLAVGVRERKAADGSMTQKNFAADVIRASTVKKAEDIF
jgi:hypothetical protein